MNGELETLKKQTQGQVSWASTHSLTAPVDRAFRDSYPTPESPFSNSHLVGISPQAMHPLFTDSFGSGSIHQRSYSVKQQGVIPNVIVVKGAALGVEPELVHDSTLKRIFTGEFPYMLKTPSAQKQWDLTLQLHALSRMLTGEPAPAALPISIEAIDAIEGIPVGEYLRTSYLGSRQSDLVNVWNDFCAKNSDEFFNGKPADSVADIVTHFNPEPAALITNMLGYDLRMCELPSTIMLPQADAFLKYDPLRLLAAKNCGIFIGAPDAIARGGGNIDNVIRTFYTSIADSYLVKIPLPDYEITETNYLGALLDLQENIPLGTAEEVITAFSRGIALGAALAHANEMTYSSIKYHEGGSLISRNVALGVRTKEDVLKDKPARVMINDLVTLRRFDSQSGPEIRALFMMKDIREMLNSIACLTRIFAIKARGGVYDTAVDEYERYLRIFGGNKHIGLATSVEMQEVALEFGIL